MKPEEQIRALAKLDGWKETRLNDGTTWPTNILGQYGMDSAGRMISPPKYLTSYDAIIPLVKKQEQQIVFAMHQWLPQSSCGSFSQIGMQFVFWTPAQLCEALLRATGKWEE